MADQELKALLNVDELAAFNRCVDCFDDGEGYDVPKPMMSRLAQIGVLRHVGKGVYETTEFGMHIRLADISEKVGVPTAQAGDDYVLMPRRLTAENGGKYALSGEFCEKVEVLCPECDQDEPDLGCTMCEGHGLWVQDVPVEWSTIKNIYRKAVECCAAPSQPVADHIGDANEMMPATVQAKALTLIDKDDLRNILDDLRSGAISANAVLTLENWLGTDGLCHEAKALTDTELLNLAYKVSDSMPRDRKWSDTLIAYGRALLASQPSAQPIEQKPVAHQFYQGGQWHNFLNERHHLETVKAGYPVRALYAHTSAPADVAAVRDAALEEAAEASENAWDCRGAAEAIRALKSAMTADKSHQEKA